MASGILTILTSIGLVIASTICGGSIVIVKSEDVPIYDGNGNHLTGEEFLTAQSAIATFYQF